MVAATPLTKTVLKLWHSHGLVQPIKRPTFPRPSSSLYICCLDHCDFRPLRLILNTTTRLVFHLPGPSHVFPLVQFHRQLLVLNTDSFSWQSKLQRDPLAHTSRQLCRSTHSSRRCLSATGHSACHFDSCPVWLWSQQLLYFTHLLQFLLHQPIGVYYMTTFRSFGLLEEFCKFSCCPLIKLLRTGAPVKLMKCKCQSFCLCAVYHFALLLFVSVLWRRWKFICVPTITLHQLAQLSSGQLDAFYPEYGMHVCPPAACIVLSPLH